jgi:hypothetical protein
MEIGLKIRDHSVLSLLSWALGLLVGARELLHSSVGKLWAMAVDSASIHCCKKEEDDWHTALHFRRPWNSVSIQVFRLFFKLKELSLEID